MPPASSKRPPSSLMRPSSRFMAGLPIKLATKRLAGFSYTSTGVPICSATPLFITITRWARVIASTWSWVTYSEVVFRRRCSCCNSRRICTRSLASRFDNGSSKRNTAGSRTMARPIATRWRWPPDSSRGRRLSRPSSSRMRAASCTRSAINPLPMPRIFSPHAMFSSTLICG